jgi:hypothetical protein
VSEKHLGFFFESGPNIKLVSMRAGAVLPAGRPEGHRAMFMLEGNLAFDGGTFEPTSYFMLPSGEPYAEFRANKDTELLVIGWSASEAIPFALF